MPAVNLLPWREEQRRKRQQRFLFALCVAVLAGAGAVYAARLTVQGLLADQDARNRTLRYEIELLDDQLEDLARLESRRDRLLARMQIIAELQRSRPLAVRLFDELVEILPAGVQLVDVAQNGNRIVLEGMAESNSRVAALMRNIDASPWLQAPRLERVESAADGAVRSARFTIAMEQAAAATEQ